MQDISHRATTTKVIDFPLRLVALTALLLSVAEGAAATTAIQWQRWEESLTSSVTYSNPYSDVTVSVTYTGPEGSTLQTLGFWDGGGTFKIRCAFPSSGVWSWQTTCSDSANAGLHQQSGSVTVTPCSGDLPLYRHGSLRVSANRRYLTFHDGTPFLWMGDTAWVAPLGASQSDWQTYIADRKAKHFTVIQIAPASRWSGLTTDTEGNEPFFGADLAQWNPAYWRGFEQKVQHANEQGLCVLVVGIMEPESRYPNEAEARLFARNLAARLFGNFVIFSPSFDSPYQALGDQVGSELDSTTAAHLITQHVGTSLSAAQSYYDQPYLDFSGCQSGHNNGNRSTCAANAINWNLALYNRTPCKPVINLEAFYDANGTASGLEGKYQGTARDARSLGYLSWLSGALGYTYGAYGVWNWKTDPAQAYYWSNAIAYPSSTQMRYLHDFFLGLEWWRLEPAHSLIVNQASEPTNQMVLAKSAGGDLAVAYLPNNAEIRINMAAFPKPMRAQWFNPTNAVYAPISQIITNGRIQTFAAPAAGDWVLLLTGSKPRLIVNTDIGGDPDDQQSLVRLLAYANEFDLEGLIATSRMIHGQDVMPVLITNTVQAYGQVLSNLSLHATGWPALQYLLDRIKAGQGDQYSIGAGFDTAGSGHIISVVDADDPRPVWVTIWGGCRELRQALWRISQDRTQAQVDAFVAKLRVHAIADQDGHGAPIRAAYPGIFWIDNGAGLSQTYQVFRGQYQTGVTTQQDGTWVNANVRTGHGNLGAQYPQNGAGVNGMKEGDTPSFTYVLPSGLSDPSQPGWGGWGGRFQLASNQVYTGAQDALEGTGFGGANERYTVARWRPYYQNDFAVRMDWCVQAYAGANHRPIAFANNDGSRAFLSNSVAPGALVQLDARGSFDPDGDSLSYTWFFYQDAGSATNGIVLSNANTAVASFIAPTNTSSQSLHCILAVTDDGSPPLSSFRRVLLSVSSLTNGVGTNCLIGHWKLDEGTGVIAADATSNNVTGTLLNGPVWTGGKYGQALLFDGVNDRVGLGNPAHLRLTGAMTLAAWVWIESFAGNGRIVNKQGTSGSRGWSLNVESGGYASFQVARDASTLVAVNSSALPVRQWVHLAGTYEPGIALRVYINGVPDRTLTAGVPSSQYNSGLDVAIGDRPVGGTPFNGRLDDVRIYSCAQSQSQIAALGPLRFSSATRSANQFSLSWTGQGHLEYAPVLPGPWSLVIPAPAPPYTEEIALDQNRFFRLTAEQ